MIAGALPRGVSLLVSTEDGDSALLVRLAREEIKRETEPKPLAIPGEVSRVPGPDQAAEARRTALIARLERLAESAG